jgi:hypothetical protein
MTDGERFRVMIAEPAETQIDSHQAWWIANRPAARNAFALELARAFEQLEHAPNSGAPYIDRSSRHPVRRLDGVRRLSLATGHALYYITHAWEFGRRLPSHVTIIAVTGPYVGFAPEL